MRPRRLFRNHVRANRHIPLHPHSAAAKDVLARDVGAGDPTQQQGVGASLRPHEQLRFLVAAGGTAHVLHNAVRMWTSTWPSLQAGNSPPQIRVRRQPLHYSCQRTAHSRLGANAILCVVIERIVRLVYGGIVFSLWHTSLSRATASNSRNGGSRMQGEGGEPNERTGGAVATELNQVALDGHEEDVKLVRKVLVRKKTRE